MLGLIFLQVSNIRNKNAEGMPAVMLTGGIVCSSCWLVYGIMLKDPNIYVSGNIQHALCCIIHVITLLGLHNYGILNILTCFWCLFERVKFMQSCWETVFCFTVHLKNSILPCLHICRPIYIDTVTGAYAGAR